MKVNIKTPDKFKAKQLKRLDNLLETLDSVDITKVDNLIDNNVNDLESAKRVLKALTKYVLLKNR